jgi:hypothetical protein
MPTLSPLDMGPRVSNRPVSMHTFKQERIIRPQVFNESVLEVRRYVGNVAAHLAQLSEHLDPSDELDVLRQTSILGRVRRGILSLQPRGKGRTHQKSIRKNKDAFRSWLQGLSNLHIGLSNRLQVYLCDQADAFYKRDHALIRCLPRRCIRTRAGKTKMEQNFECRAIAQARPDIAQTSTELLLI